MNDYRKEYIFKENKIAEYSSLLYSNIQKIVPKKPVEAEFRAPIDNILEKFCDELGLAPLIHKEYTLLTGKVDAVFNRLIIEYKKPWVLKSPPDAATRKAIDQLKNYMIGYAKKQKQSLKRLAGVLLDGNYIFFIRYKGSECQEEQPCEVNNNSLYRLLSWLSSLSSGIALTADNLNRDFSIEQLSTQSFLKSLFDALQVAVKKSDSLTIKLYEQWRIFFSEAIDYSEAFGGDKLGQLRKWAKKAGINVANTDEAQQFFFILHTYFALLAKLLAWLAVSRHLGGKLYAPAFGELASLDTDELRKRLEFMESGGIFREYGILNFLEGDFFSWYIKTWNDQIDDTLRKILRILDGYDPTTLAMIPEETRDLFKKFYHYILPREIRHNLGEYYTPDWLAEYLLSLIDEEIFAEEPRIENTKLRRKLLNIRFLDPACGSGTFLVLIIKRLKKLGAFLQIGENEILERVLSNVIGFDINPLAVLTSRVNYLLSISDLLEYRKGSISIPVYVADSIRTPAFAREIFKQNVFEFQTAVGKFLVPAILCKADKFDQFCEKLEKSIKADISPESFISIIKQFFNFMHGEWDDKAASYIRELYNSFLYMHKQGLNGHWSRLLKNNFAPLIAGEFDFIVGNPPWINWEHLPDDYRDSIKILWDQMNINAKISIGKKWDISYLMTQICANNLLKKKGRLAFVITQSVFKTNLGARGFRRFMLPNGIPLKVLKVDDMVDIKPFEGAINRTAIILIEKGLSTIYPVPYTVWKKKKKARFNYDSNIQDVIRNTSRLAYQAEPINPKDKLSPWLTASSKAINGIKKVLGKSRYRGHEGANTGGANGVFWVDILEHRADGLAFITNLSDSGKKRDIDKSKEFIEVELLFPLLRGRDMKRWWALPSANIIMTYRKNKDGRHEIIPLKEMETNYPCTLSYLRKFEEILKKRTHYKHYFESQGKPFYSMMPQPGVFNAWKVVWREQSRELTAAVIGHLNGKPIIPDHKVMLVECKNELEAHFICALLNSTPASFAALSFAIMIQIGPNLLDQIHIPYFDSNNLFHRRIAELSIYAHEAAEKGEWGKIGQIEKEIDKMAGKIWQLTDEELLEIKKSLHELYIGSIEPGCNIDR